MIKKAVLNGLYYSGLDRLLSPLTGGFGSIWMLHRVGNCPNNSFSPNKHLSVTPEFLDMAILYSKSKGYEFVTMDEMANVLKSGKSSRAGRKLISITLDDGYCDNLENAVPVFRKHKVPYTIYIAPGLVDATHTLWWEDLEHVVSSTKRLTVKLDGSLQEFETKTARQKADVFCTLLTRLSSEINEDSQREIMDILSAQYGHDAYSYVASEIMNWEQLVALDKDPLCTIGAHTIGHFALARLPDSRARSEMSASRTILEDRLGHRVEHFAFPYGYPAAACRREFEIAEELGFKTAVTTRHGVLYDGDEKRIHGLPRLSINGHFQSIHYLRTLQSGLTTKLYRLAGEKKVA